MTFALRRSTLPVLVIFGVCLLSGAIGYFTAPRERPQPTTTVASPAATAEERVIGGTLVSYDEGTGVLHLDTEGGPEDVTIPNQALFESLTPIDLAAIKVGDWVNAGASHELENLVTLTGLVVIPSEAVQAP